MTIVKIYGRMSSDKQSGTSIEDQVRRCRELAERLGYTVPDECVFSDAAISGTESGFHQRKGYHALMSDWDKGNLDILIVDDFSRLSRDGLEQAKLIRRLSKSKRVRLLTCDGIDTAKDGWQLLVSVKGLIAQEGIRQLEHQVGRGMVGQLERGYMVATPPFGYDLKRIYDDSTKHVGTRWVINEHEAAIVRAVFQRRENGQSMHQIAAWLNSSGVPTTRKARSESGGFWRPSRIRTLLNNPIYRGEFVWHGSTNYQYQAQERGETVERKHYPRPELRLVSDETWWRCHQKTHSRTGYGGGKHYLAGFITCGACGRTLALSAVSSRRSVYCSHCTVASRVMPGQDRLTGTVAVSGMNVLLQYALRYFLSPAFVEAFRTSLRLRLSGDNRAEVEECRGRLKTLRSSQERFAKMLGDISEDDPVLTDRYVEVRQKVRDTEAKLAQLEAGLVRIDAQAVKAQMEVDPVKLIGSLFDADFPPERLRAVLSRVFPAFVFEGKQGRYTSVFRMRFAAGAALAIASGTEVQADGSVELRFKLNYKPDRFGGPKWTCAVVESEPG